MMSRVFPAIFAAVTYVKYLSISSDQGRKPNEVISELTSVHIRDKNSCAGLYQPISTSLPASSDKETKLQGPAVANV